MDVPNYPYQGAERSRTDRYLGSLKSHCKNLGYPIICYTQNKNLDELLKFKQLHGLDNLIIKIRELSDMKLHKEISSVRDKFYDTNFNGRGMEIMWGKIDLMERELNNTDYIFWIDVGLQHPGIFPWMYNDLYFDKTLHSFENGKAPIWNDKQQTQYTFGKILNKKIIDKISLLSRNKTFLITVNQPQCDFSGYIKNNILNEVLTPHIIGGIFGGDVSTFKEFINNFWGYANKNIEYNFFSTEEAIMKICYEHMNKDNFITFNFDVWQTNIQDEYHFEVWDISWNKPKPFYVVFNEILKY
jgi:hypothetical protein